MADLPILEGGAILAVAVVVVKEAFSFVKAQRNKTGNSYVTRTEFQTHKDSVQYKDNCEQIVKRLDAAFEAQEKMFKLMEKRIEDHFRDVKKLIRNGGK